MLLEADSDPNNASAFPAARKREDNAPVVIDIIAALLDANADGNTVRYSGTYPPLHLLLRSQPNSVALVELLPGAGADSNARAEYAWTPLNVAARYTANPRVPEALVGCRRECRQRRPGTTSGEGLRCGSRSIDVDRVSCVLSWDMSRVPTMDIAIRVSPFATRRCWMWLSGALENPRPGSKEKRSCA